MPDSVLAYEEEVVTKVWEHRCVTPLETIERLRPVVEALGVTRVADLTQLDRLGIPVFQAVRPMGKLLTVSQGKGLTKDAAKASAIMESIELWHAENLSVPCIRSSPSTGIGQPFVDPMRYPGPRYAGESIAGAFWWASAEDVRTGKQILVPRDLIDLDYTRRGSPPWLLRNSNGLAGGNTIWEALASGIAEVVERASRLEFRDLLPHQKAQRRIDAHDMAKRCDTIAQLVRRVHNCNLELELSDMTNSTGITTIGASIYERSTTVPVGPPAFGHGAHLDPVTAITRAITEAAQSRLTQISGNRDDIELESYAPNNFANLTRSLEVSIDLCGSNTSLKLQDQSSHSPREDVEKMVNFIELANHGPVLFVDLTHPDLGIPVVKVITPNFTNAPTTHRSQ